MSETKRDWQTGKTFEISTIHWLLKEPRDYKFRELNQRYGGRLLHQYVLIILHQWKHVKKLVDDFKDLMKKFANDEEKAISVFMEDSDKTVGLLADILPGIFTWNAIEDMAKMLLADHEVTIDGETYKADENGFIDELGDPFAVYNALFFAICQNWPKYVLPLLGTDLDGLTRDSGPEQKSNEAGEK